MNKSQREELIAEHNRSGRSQEITYPFSQRNYIRLQQDKDYLEEKGYTVSMCDSPGRIIGLCFWNTLNPLWIKRVTYQGLPETQKKRYVHFCEGLGISEEVLTS